LQVFSFAFGGSRQNEQLGLSRLSNSTTTLLIIAESALATLN
jgi:hypothetical protein